MTITVDARTLAKGWLSVAVASGSRSSAPQLDRTVLVEQHAHGLRLVATDSYMLLTAWIPDEDIEPEPSYDEVPYATAVVFDEWGRGAGLLRHFLALARADEDKEEIDFAVNVRLNVPWQAPSTDSGDLQLDGFAALAVTIEHPDRERLQLPVYEGRYVSWQKLLVAHRMQRPMALAMSADILARLGKAAKVHGNATVHQRFGGQHKPVHVTFGTDPVVVGLAMPCRWDLDANTAAVDEPEGVGGVTVPDPIVCSACGRESCARGEQHCDAYRTAAFVPLSTFLASRTACPMCDDEGEICGLDGSIIGPCPCVTEGVGA